MRITLGVDFQPCNENWESYCHRALEILRDNKDCGADLQYSEDGGLFCITGLPGMQEPPWFKLKEGHFFDFANVLCGWIKMLGPSTLIKPVIETESYPVGQVRHERLVLKAQVQGTAEEIGLYRVLSSLLFAVDDLNDGDVSMLRSIGEAVRQRRRETQPSSAASTRAEAQYKQEYPTGQKH